MPDIIPCSHHSSVPGLHGPFFQLLKQIDGLESSYCIFAKNCSFEDTVQFIGNISKLEYPHKFMVGGLMFVTEQRITNHTIPSVPLTEGSFVLLGNREELAHESNSGTYYAWSSFSSSAIALFLLSSIILLFMRALISLTFTTPRTFSNVMSSFWGFSGTKHDAEDEIMHFWLLFLNNLIRNAGSFLFISMILFYELSAVNFLFQNIDGGLDERFDGQSCEEISQFAVIAGDAQEYFFNKMVRNGNSRCDNPTWTSVKDSNEKFKLILDPEEPVVRGISYDVSTYFRTHHFFINSFTGSSQVPA